MRVTLTKSALVIPLFYLIGAQPLNALAADPEASAKMDPCSLVTAAEAKAVLGVEIAAPLSSDDGLMRHCVYSSADKRNNLMLEAKTTDKALFERFMKMNGTPVPQLGSDAYLNGGRLLIWKNGTQVNVHIDDRSGKSTDQQQEAAEQKVAALVLSRL